MRYAQNVSDRTFVEPDCRQEKCLEARLDKPLWEDALAKTPAAQDGELANNTSSMNPGAKNGTLDRNTIGC